MEPGLGPKAAALCPGRPALLLWVSTLSCSVSSLASPSPSLVPQVRTSYNSGRTFLGLDKCNACIGTSICKKFFKEEIRFDILLASRLRLPPDYLPSYPANYSDDSKTWRPVELLRLVGKQQSEISDRRICASAAAPNTCSIERVLRKTGRFQKWLQAKRLTPDLVQVSVLAVGQEGVGTIPISPLSAEKDLWSVRSGTKQCHETEWLVTRQERTRFSYRDPSHCRPPFSLM
ncbi:hypothetical protein MC885_005278 [Smutsia gigantea]|nr:hypothetical protein MC885_005278 [Smutsia gigantea]